MVKSCFWTSILLSAHVSKGLVCLSKNLLRGLLTGFSSLWIKTSLIQKILEFVFDSYGVLAIMNEFLLCSSRHASSVGWCRRYYWRRKLRRKNRGLRTFKIVHIDWMGQGRNIYSKVLFASFTSVFLVFYLWSIHLFDTGYSLTFNKYSIISYADFYVTDISFHRNF